MHVFSSAESIRNLGFPRRSAVAPRPRQFHCFSPAGAWLPVPGKLGGAVIQDLYGFNSARYKGRGNLYIAGATSCNGFCISCSHPIQIITETWHPRLPRRRPRPSRASSFLCQHQRILLSLIRILPVFCRVSCMQQNMHQIIAKLTLE